MWILLVVGCLLGCAVVPMEACWAEHLYRRQWRKPVNFANVGLVRSSPVDIYVADLTAKPHKCFRVKNCDYLFF